MSTPPPPALRSLYYQGGEDPVRFLPIEDVSAETGESTSFPHLKELRNGDLAASAIKQVASGRFGVTPEYLVSAEQVRACRYERKSCQLLSCSGLTRPL